MKNQKKNVTVAMLCAMAYAVMLVGRVPVVLFLKYDPKDIVITIGSFIYGPLTGVLMSVVVSLIEMFTVSESGFIGLIMNIISTCAFVCPAAYIYKKNKTIKGAAIGLITGTILMTIAMLVWNYLITPLYMVGVSREAIAKMLIPTFLPFNLLKAGLNSAAVMLIYKPVVSALRKANFIPESQGIQNKSHTGAMLVSGIVAATCILFVLVLQGVI